jgi:TRAP transporter 4TM/12TM fusion protein
MSNSVAANSLPDEFSGRTRRMGNTFWGQVIRWGSVILSLFHLYTAGFGTLPMIKQRSVHLGLVMFLVYLLFPRSKRHSSRTKMPAEAVVMAALGLALNAYVYVRFDQIAMTSGILRRWDLIVGALLIIVVLEGCRRTSGNALPILMTCALLYCYFGPYFPSFFRHNGLSLHRIIQYMIWTTEGIYGLVLGVSSTYLFVFILFGSVLDKTGLAGVINDLALSLAGGARGGPAKVAIIASACMGTISGSAVANVATTGTLTIPMMKRTGYSPVFAASVEAVASTGGMIMPPIMGASAMIMAEFLGVPYVMIMKAALIPALLYYFAVWMVVDFEARRLNLPTLRREEMLSFKDVFVKRGYLLIPIAVLVGLMVYGRTPLFSSFWAIVVAVVVSSLRKQTRLTPETSVAALEDAGKLAIPVANTCAAVGIMVGMTGATGLGMVLGDGLIKIAGGNFYLTLFFAMLTCMILGMGLPSSACYIVVSTLAAPALLRFGISGIPVHMFAFYYGILSVLTPPVCTASYTAAGIAGTDPTRVGYSAFRMAAAGFLIPYMFITTPELLLLGGTPLSIASKILTALIGTTALAISVVGFLKTKLYRYERVAAFLAGILLMDGGLATDIGGAAILVVIIALNFARAKKEPTPAGAS